jgi:glucan phosphoethanolaminetransferase (alkaline phosphatase superfamily)
MLGEKEVKEKNSKSLVLKEQENKYIYIYIYTHAHARARAHAWNSKKETHLEVFYFSCFSLFRFFRRVLHFKWQRYSPLLPFLLLFSFVSHYFLHWQRSVRTDLCAH